MIRFYFVGLSILIVAIFANYVAGLLQFKTWYGFLQDALAAQTLWIPLKIMDVLWLFILYPLLLGASTALGDLLYQKLF